MMTGNIFFSLYLHDFETKILKVLQLYFCKLLRRQVIVNFDVKYEFDLFVEQTSFKLLSKVSSQRNFHFHSC